MLVKALPHVGKEHGETVCCAGVTVNGEWRRLFPVPFRRLDEKFKRWNLIQFKWRTALPKDQRKESRRIQENSIKVIGSLQASSRARLLGRVIVASTDEAVSRGQTLALIRPSNVRFDAVRKTNLQIAEEKRAYASAVAQSSFLDDELRALEPCPYSFVLKYNTSDQKSHRATSDDWETAAMFYKFRNLYGEVSALEKMKETFENLYPSKGVAFAMGTHSKYPKTWLLVGILRLDENRQGSLL